MAVQFPLKLWRGPTPGWASAAEARAFRDWEASLPTREPAGEFTDAADYGPDEHALLTSTPEEQARLDAMTREYLQAAHDDRVARGLPIDAERPPRRRR